MQLINWQRFLFNAELSNADLMFTPGCLPAELKCNVWEELSPSFKELVSCLEDENEILHIGYVKTWLDYQIVLSKDRQVKNTPNHDKIKFLSANLPTNKKAKTHGTKF